MKKCFYLLFACFMISASAKAAPGDTTWVQANVDSLDNYGDYDSTVTFPSGATTYRNVYMVFTLGKHACPAGSTYCGDWDYTVQNYLMTPGGDTMELGRFITPYANAGAPRTPFTWTQRYIYDVTDYVSKLQGSATMRIHYSGYSGGFTANIRFAFVEGTPDRTVTGIERLWDGSYGYGGTPDINTHFPAVTKVAPAGTASAEVKFTVTGHGSDAAGCCEFATHNYQVMLNGTSVATKAIWRDDCGLNELSPQSGTWVYDRGNWCPGAIVYSNEHTLPGIVAGSSYNVAIQFDPYTGSGGSYTTYASLINYGVYNKATDAGIEQIIAPTNNENFFRENPVVGKPTIRIKNRGAATITAATIQYGLQDSAMSTYNWTGSLAPQEEADVILPELPALDHVAGVSGLFTFVAKITAVNGGADADATDDMMTSQFTSGPVWPSPFRIQMNTNNEANSTGNSETSWKIYDMSGNVVASRTDAAISHNYLDTISNLYTGAYKLEITDEGCDGLHWWVHASAGDGVTTGSFAVKQYAAVTNIPMNGYTSTGTYANDFGCGFTQYFYVNRAFATGVNNITNFPAAMEAYPNPAQGVVNVDFSGIDKIAGTIQIIDVMGRVAVTVPCTGLHQQLSLTGLNAGVYTIQFVNAAGNTLKSRLMVTK